MEGAVPVPPSINVEWGVQCRSGEQSSFPHRHVGWFLSSRAPINQCWLLLCNANPGIRSADSLPHSPSQAAVARRSFSHGAHARTAGAGAACLSSSTSGGESATHSPTPRFALHLGSSAPSTGTWYTWELCHAYLRKQRSRLESGGDDPEPPNSPSVLVWGAV